MLAIHSKKLKFSKLSVVPQSLQLRFFALEQEEERVPYRQRKEQSQNARRPVPAVAITLEIKNVKNDHDLWRTLFKYRTQLDTKHIAASLHVLARLSTKYDTASVGKRSEGVENRWSEKVVNLCCNRLKHNVGELDGKGVSFVIWSIGRLKVKLEDSILKDLMERAKFVLPKMDSMSLTQVLIGMAAMPYMADVQIIESIIQRLKAEKLIRDFDVRGAANCAWALASLNWKQNPEIFDQLQTFGMQREGFQPQELVNLTWACAKCVKPLDRKFLQVMSGRAKNVLLDRFTGQNMSNFLWACAINHFYDVELLQMMDEKAAEKVEEFSPNQVSMMLSSFGKLRYPSKRFVVELYRRYDHNILVQQNESQIAFLIWGISYNFKSKILNNQEDVNSLFSAQKEQQQDDVSLLFTDQKRRKQAALNQFFIDQEQHKLADSSKFLSGEKSRKQKAENFQSNTSELSDSELASLFVGSLIKRLPTKFQETEWLVKSMISVGKLQMFNQLNMKKLLRWGIQLLQVKQELNSKDIVRIMVSFSQIIRFQRLHLEQNLLQEKDQVNQQSDLNQKRQNQDLLLEQQEDEKQENQDKVQSTQTYTTNTQNQFETSSNEQSVEKQDQQQQYQEEILPEQNQLKQETQEKQQSLQEETEDQSKISFVKQFKKKVYQQKINLDSLSPQQQIYQVLKICGGLLDELKQRLENNFKGEMFSRGGGGGHLTPQDFCRLCDAIIQLQIQKDQIDLFKFGLQSIQPDGYFQLQLLIDLMKLFCKANFVNEQDLWLNAVSKLNQIYLKCQQQSLNKISQQQFQQIYQIWVSLKEQELNNLQEDQQSQNFVHQLFDQKLLHEALQNVQEK